jgi:hypothetical protein
VTAVITGIYGTIDWPKPDPILQSVDCDYFMVTDNEYLRVPGWEMVYDPPDGRHPRMQAKKPKLSPWKFLLGDPPWIWIDGSMEIASSHFVEEALEASFAFGNPLAQWAHPDRICIYPEADLSATLAKYDNTPVLEQADHYARIGHPKDWGLWATGLIVYNRPLPYLADLWWAEMNQWGYQDQISQPVALRAAGLRPVNLPHDLRVNPWIRLHSHLTHL